MKLSLPVALYAWRFYALAAVAGALTPLSFAPFDCWPMAVISVALLGWLLFQTSGKQAFWRSWWFGLGMFGTGTSWVFVSIHVFGNAPLPFAILLTGLFVILLASVFSLPFIVLGKWCSQRPLPFVIGFICLWCLGEWLRTWLFTGFPWLFLGYGHLETWLSGWAPVTGVLGMSLAAVLTSVALTFAWLTFTDRQRQHYFQAGTALAVAALFWVGGAGLKTVQWTHPYDDPVSVGLAQGNIPQDKKWDRDFIDPTLERYLGLSETLWQNDWVVWPEAAIPLIMNFPPHNERLAPILEQVKRKAVLTETTFITGILYYSPSEAKYYNSIIATGLGAGVYHKQRLAPFGDYVPLSDWFGPVLALFNLPHSILELGPPNQKGLQAGNAFVSPAICYEIAYPDLVAHGANHGHALITVSNDAWFGRSIGPLQHMQIARMRALENDRYLIRATNNGVSGIVNDEGKIIARSEQFVQASLSSEIILKQGATPFMRYGSTPTVLLCVLLLAAAIGWSRWIRG